MKQGSRQTKIASALSALRKRWGVKLILALCVGVIASVNAYSDGRLSAKAYLALNYENASKGLYPNGTRFNMYDIISDDIVTQAIEESGMSGILSANELSQSLSVGPRYTRSTLEQYIGTEYTIGLWLDEALPYISTRDLLMRVCKAYSDFFRDSYVSNETLYSCAVADTESFDYSEIAQLFNTSLSQIKDYLSRRNKQNGVFRSETTGETFASLTKRVNNFNDVLYSNYVAYINETGVTKQLTEYKAELDYRQYLLNNEYDVQLLAYSARLEAIEKFSSYQNDVMLIPTYDAAGSFYMSKTKIGKDYLAQDAQKYMYAAKDVHNELLTNELLISKLQDAAKNRAVQAKAESMVETMLSELNSLLELIKRTDDDFVAYTLSGCLSFRASTFSFVEKYDLQNAFLLMVFFYFLMSAVQMILHSFETRQTRHGLIHTGSGEKRGDGE